MSDEAIVLRGGPIVDSRGNPVPFVFKNYATVQSAYHVCGLCATVGLGDAKAVAATSRSKHDSLRVAKVSSLRAAGFDVVLEPGHTDADALIVTPDTVTIEDWRRLEAILAQGGSVDNPNGKRYRKDK